MQSKRVLIPERLRKVPREFGFGWIDRRLLHESYVRRFDPSALALYLLLIVVADAEGLSFYADATLARLLSLPVGAIGCGARATLILVGRIAYQVPITQVLSFDPPSPPRTPGVRSVDTVLKAMRRPWHGRRRAAGMR
jgi:hypothetical protein